MTAGRKRAELPQAGGAVVNDSPVGCQSHRSREKRACSAGAGTEPWVAVGRRPRVLRCAGETVAPYDAVS